MAWLGGGLAVVVVIAVAAVHFFGPFAGIAMRGKPFFLFPPSPERYAAVSLDAMETMGIHGSSPEFAAAREEAERMLDQAELNDYSDTWPALDLAIDAAGGKHSKVLRPDADGPRTPGSSGDADPAVTAENSGDGTVIVATVPTHGGDSGGPRSQAYADALAEGIRREGAAGACGAIVDLRGNGGGNMGPMVAGLSALLPDGDVLWFDSPRGSTAVTVTGGSVQGGGSPMTVDAGPKLDVPVAVLVDGDTGSSGEATMLAFRGLDNSRSFGAPTAGYASANSIIELPGGAKLMLTIAKDRDRTGEVHMDDPVAPDEDVTGGGAGDSSGANGPGDAKTAALEWLATRGCG